MKKQLLFILIMLNIVLLSNSQTNLITNGSFESTPWNSGWSSVNGTGLYGGSVASCPASDGSNYIWNGSQITGTNNINCDIYQTITIPSNTTYCSFAMNVSINTLETGTMIYDTLRVKFRSTSGALLANFTHVSNASSYAGSGIPGCQNWYITSSGMPIPSTYFGQTFRVSLEFRTDASNPTIFRVDNIRVLATLPASSLPTVTTTAAHSISCYEAISGGNVTNDGGGSLTQKGVCWGLTQYPFITTDNYSTDGTNAGVFVSNINYGLSPNTLYHYRAYATNSIGTAYGNDLTFTTTNGLPVVATTTATSITNNAAISGGNVTNDGGCNDSITARGICWGTNPNPITTGNHTTNGSGSGNFVSNLTSLTSSTVYHYRAYATNTTGTSYGSDMSFTTTSGLAVVTTTTATSITNTTATSGGNITSDGGVSVTVRGISWGLNANPINTDNHTIDGSGTGSFVSNLTGLSSSTVYHYRAYATNTTGTSYGSDMSFTTNSDVSTKNIDLIASTVSIIPNPSSGIFGIVFNAQQKQDVQIKVLNNLGNCILSSNFISEGVNNTLKIDLSDKAAGLYLVEIKGNDFTISRTIIINK
ncbi:MAG: T9SS type A sorting domain-containing protein [Bacteroidales bacterium]